MKKFQLFWKRFFDITVSLFLIILLTAIPVLIVVPILIKLTSKGPAVYKQERVGKDGKVFNILKFRTMSNPPEGSVCIKGAYYTADGQLIDSRDRITKIGAFLRKTSLDELMQLFNILKGDMSIVGPRPTLVYQVERYNDEQRRRLEMRPGVTGWAQVHGRNDLTWTEKIVYDLQYIDHFSLGMDIRILFLTIGTVFGGKGVAFTKYDELTNYKVDPKTQAASDAAAENKEKKMKAMVLAGGFSQIALIQELKSRGIEVILADNNPDAVARPYADGFRRGNILDPALMEQFAVEEKVDFLITACADQVLLIVAQVSEKLGLPCYLDYATAVKVSDKAEMKRIFDESGVPTSHYEVMAELDESKLEGMQYPLVVKPVDSYSSKGVRKAHDIEELRVLFAEAKEISRTKTAIVEEYVEGVEVTVDVEVVDGVAHVIMASNTEKVTADGRFVAFRTRNPAAVNEGAMERIRVIAQKIATGFGLVNTPMLIQLLSDGKRESVLEFCARTGGGAKYVLIKKVTGFDPIKAVVDLTLGNKVDMTTHPREKKVYTNEFIYCTPGVFDHLEGFEEAKRDGVIEDYYSFKWKGAKMTGNVLSSGDRGAGFMLAADSPEELNERHREALKRIKIVAEDGSDLIRRELLPEMTDISV